MSDLSALVKYRLERTKETLQEVQYLAKGNFWNAVANRLYYVCFYALLALLASEGIKASTHSGVKTMFYKHFIKTGKLSEKTGLLYNDLFNKRQEGDYQDFRSFNEQSIKPLIKEAVDFVKQIEALSKL